MKPKIIGIHVHHSVFLDDALRGAANMRAGLNSAIQRTGDLELIEIAANFQDTLKKIQSARNSAKEFIQSMPTDQVIQCREGYKPWPDEIAENFVPRCTCYDRCQIHDFGRSEDEGWICNCGDCPAHP